MSNILDKLNPPQLEAVTYGEGPMLLLAGAGSGKTRVIVQRMGYLIYNQGISPGGILAITFTNKAAKEMRQRVSNLVCGPAPLVSTFHSFCASLLRRHCEALEYKNNFAIYDDEDTRKIVKEISKTLKVDEKLFPVRSIQERIDSFKNAGMWPKDVPRDTPERATYAAVYEQYQSRLHKSNAMDFGDLLLVMVRIFRENPEILKRYAEQYKYLMVDEYQDTNIVQYQLIRQLTSVHKNVCVVGDDDQSIYSWRGADIRNILEFERDFKGAKVIRLEQNYRSTKRILQAADEVVRINTSRKGKTLWTDNHEGEKIVYRRLPNEREEASFICKEIQAHIERGKSPEEIAILYRANAQSRAIEDRMISLGIPYTMVGGMKFYERAEIKDLLAYLKALTNFDDEIAVRRIINVPARGIGDTTIKKIADFAQSNKISFAMALYTMKDNGSLPASASKKLQGFVDLMEGAVAKSETLPISDLAKHILVASGYEDSLRDERTEEALNRLENLYELLTALQEFERTSDEKTLVAFLEQVALAQDLDVTKEGVKAVTMMTLHAAKGLEFPIVFVCGMEEGLFPHARSRADFKALEEERRLCYVAITRAEHLLYMTNAEERRIFGSYQHNSPSRFITDISEDLYDVPGGIPHQHGVSLYGGKVTPKPWADLCRYTSGSRVQHPVFGHGIVIGSEGVGDSQKVVVNFGSAGMKKLLVSLANLEQA